MSTWEQMKEIINIGADVRALREDLKHLTSDVRDLRDRVIKLEGSLETTIARSETVAVKTVQQQIGIFLERTDKMNLVLQKTIDEVSTKSRRLSLVQTDGSSEPAAS